MLQVLLLLVELIKLHLIVGTTFTQIFPQVGKLKCSIKTFDWDRGGPGLLGTITSTTTTSTTALITTITTTIFSAALSRESDVLR